MPSSPTSTWPSVPPELDFNQDPPQGIAEAVFSPDRIDHAFIDRLLSKCTDRLSLLAAPATLDRVYDFGADAFDAIFNSLRATVPFAWSSMCRINGPVGPSKRWSPPTIHRRCADLANLRDPKNLYDFLKAARPNDQKPLYCLNQIGVSERPEIKAADFAKALEENPIASIPFEPQVFGAAAK